MRKLSFVLITLVLAACASFDPYNGMSFEDFRHHAGLAGRGGTELVGENGATSVYFLNGLGDQQTFYWFEDGILRKITHGTLASTKQQLKTMYKPAHLKTRKKKSKSATARRADAPLAG